MRILLVEDDTALGEGVQKGLVSDEMTVDWMHDGKQGQLALEAGDFDAIVLDLGLPRLSGLDLLRELRRQGRDVPVLILTARDTVKDRVAGLDAGADDYLVKPFELDELAARLRALVRRSHGRAMPVIHHGNLTVDPGTRSAMVDGKEIQLSARECAILVQLLDNAGYAISRERLEENLYGWQQEVDSNAIEVHIHNLRKKLGNSLIKTIRGVGYLISKERQ